jgi:hypothetical protein
VYILRRDAAQRLPVLLGGRVLPGVHRRASFAVSELTDSGSGSGGGLRIAIRGGDAMALDVVARATDGWAGGAFESVGEAAEFYRAGALGWSPARRGSALEGIELCSEPWVPQAVAVDARSSFWEEHVPPAALELDGALLLRDLPVRWQPRAVSASPAGAAVR